MTAHELAKKLLEGPDLPCYLCNSDYEQGDDFYPVYEVEYTESQSEFGCTWHSFGSAELASGTKVIVINHDYC